MPSSRQAMAATTSYFVYEGASIAEEHVERDAAVKVLLQLHHVGGMQSTGSMVWGCLSPGTAVDLTWLLVCCCLNKNQNAPKLYSEHHPPVREKVVSHIQRIGCQPEKLLYAITSSR